MTATADLTKRECKFAPAMTIEQAAAAMNVSVRSVKYARELILTGRDDLCNEVEAGRLSIHAALRLAKPEKYGPKPKDGLAALKKAWKAATPSDREAFLLIVGGRQ